MNGAGVGVDAVVSAAPSPLSSALGRIGCVQRRTISVRLSAGGALSLTDISLRKHPVNRWFVDYRLVDGLPMCNAPSPILS